MLKAKIVLFKKRERKLKWSINNFKKKFSLLIIGKCYFCLYRFKVLLLFLELRSHQTFKIKFSMQNNGCLEKETKGFCQLQHNFFINFVHACFIVQVCKVSFYPHGVLGFLARRSKTGRKKGNYSTCSSYRKWIYNSISFH